MYTARAYAATNAKTPLEPATIERRDPTERDVRIEILYCGICHSDVHYARNEWSAMPAVFPAVPGHEIVGRVTAVGGSVTKVKVGDVVGVGCMVGADLSCPMCKKNQEQFCSKMVLTYGSPDPMTTGRVTYGGYSESIVVDEHFVLKVPANLNLAAVAPLLCAGITTYSPLRYWDAKKGKKVGIVGLGGLGHMGVKFSHALGAHTVVFTTSPKKKEDALRLGADEVIVSTDPAEMARHAGSFDIILDCVAAEHDLNAYIQMLAVEGTLIMVGAPDTPFPVSVFGLIFGRRSVAGSLIGGIAETQEMLDFCGEHNIAADVEVIPIQKINEAWDRVVKSDVKYRFSIDMSSLKAE
jgi:uncharacterized zinc-type alcohol dehydrogenase-like protein